MAHGIGPKVPLAVDPSDGVRMIKTFKEMVQDYLTNLILTNPGERVMHSEYGCGLMQLLFEQSTIDLQGEIEERITDQAKRYMGYVQILDVTVKTYQELDLLDPNSIAVSVSYLITPLGVRDSLLLTPDFLER
jgi:phage baseplate assembly protein W